MIKVLAVAAYLVQPWHMPSGWCEIACAAECRPVFMLPAKYVLPPNHDGTFEIDPSIVSPREGGKIIVRLPNKTVLSERRFAMTRNIKRRHLLTDSDGGRSDDFRIGPHISRWRFSGIGEAEFDSPLNRAISSKSVVCGGNAINHQVSADLILSNFDGNPIGVPLQIKGVNESAKADDADRASNERQPSNPVGGVGHALLGAKIIIFMTGGIAWGILWFRFVTERAPYGVWHLPYAIISILVWVIGCLAIVAGLVWAVV